MRLLRAAGESLELVTFYDERTIPKYAILSHTWLDDAREEVTFDDVTKKFDITAKIGWEKVKYTRKQALRDQLEYVWIDTCCIDKSSSAELAEAINSMYRWYGNSSVCYVYLADLPEPGIVPGAPGEPDEIIWDGGCLRACRWFTRGWTLQEMLSPPEVQFYSSAWGHVGSLKQHADLIAEITGIDQRALRRSRHIQNFSIAQRMSWASRRGTTRIEDEAYSLLGIFGVHLPIIYGEGHNAFMRLQEELLRVFDDHTIFAWSVRDDCFDTGCQEIDCHISKVRNTRTQRCVSHVDWVKLDPSTSDHSLMAASAYDFRNCGRLVPVATDKSRQAYDISNKSIIAVELPCFEERDSSGDSRGKVKAVLNCYLEGDRTKEIVLNLTTHASQGTLADLSFVDSESHDPRVHLADIYHMSQVCTVRKLNILRNRYGIINEDRTHLAERHITVLCRFDLHVPPSLQLGSEFVAVSCSAGVAWDHRSCSFQLPLSARYGYTLRETRGSEWAILQIKCKDLVYGSLRVTFADNYEIMYAQKSIDLIARFVDLDDDGELGRQDAKGSWWMIHKRLVMSVSHRYEKFLHEPQPKRVIQINVSHLCRGIVFSILGGYSRMVWQMVSSGILQAEKGCADFIFNLFLCGCIWVAELL